MEKSFTYGKIVKSVYLEYSDENEDFVEEFEYEVDKESLLDGVVELVYEDYFSKSKLKDNLEYSSSVKQAIRNWIDYLDNLDDLVEEYEKELREMFEQEAFDNYER